MQSDGDSGKLTQQTTQDAQKQRHDASITGGRASAQTGGQQTTGMSLEDQERVIHVLVVGTIEEAQLLLSVGGIIGGIDIEQNEYLESRGIRISRVTIVDATIIHAPSSTKNRSGERDPEMHQTRKGRQWYFGLKAHIGVDSKQGHVHSVCTSAASVADKHMLPDLLHGEERKVWGDGAYQGQGEAIRQAAPQAQDMTSRRVQYKNYVDELQKAKNRVKARVRAKVEHPFRVLKRIFGFEKVRYRGLKKNHQRLCACFALVNLYLHRKRLAVA